MTLPTPNTYTDDEVVWNDEIDLSEYEVWSKGKVMDTVEKLAART